MDTPTSIALVASIAAVISAGAAAITSWQAGQLAQNAEKRKAAELRKGVAGAILGELEAYLELIDVPKTRSYLLDILVVSDSTLLKLLVGSFPELPKTHPVFDQCAHQIGILGGDLPREISKIYNIITGFRILMTNLSSPGVAAAPAGVAREFLKQLVVALDKGQALADHLMPRLRAIASPTSQPLWIRTIRQR